MPHKDPAIRLVREDDAVKVLKLKEPYEPGEMELTGAAGDVASIVEKGLLKIRRRRAPPPRRRTTPT